MADLLIVLLPAIIGSALVVVPIMVAILLLRSPGGIASALAFAAGMLAIRASGTAVLALIFEGESAAAAAADEGGQSLALSGILLVLGLVLLLGAVRLMFVEEDPDAPPPKWMSLMDSMTPPKAFLLGAGALALSLKQWVFMLSAVKATADADLSTLGAVVTFVVFIVLAESLVLAPIIVYAVAGRRAEAVLESGTKWLQRNNRLLTIAVGLVFGGLFFYKGLAGMGVL